MIYDPTLKWRRKRSAEINSVSRSREELEVIWGKTWDHLQLRREYNRFFFANPILICFTNIRPGSISGGFHSNRRPSDVHQLP